MKPILACMVLAAIANPAFGEGSEVRKVLSTVAVDFDGDGKVDKAELVLVNPESVEAAFNENGNYLVADAERIDLVITFENVSGKAAFVKKKIVDPEVVFMVSALESKAMGSVSITSCYGCGAMKSWDQTLTIAYRNGNFVVAGYSRDWEFGTHMADGNVETLIGGCDINYLTGKGMVSKGLDAGQPVNARFKTVRLADWSEAKLPKACDF